MKKKITIIIAIIVVIILMFSLTVVLLNFNNNSLEGDNLNTEPNIEQSLENNANENTNQIPNNFQNNTTSSTVVTDTNTNINQNQPVSADGQSFRGDWVWNGQRLPNSTENYDNVPRRDSSGANTYDNDTLVLQNINKQEYINNAIMFLNGFLTYNASTLANNQYKSSWQSFVHSDALSKNTGSGLLYQHALPAWNNNMSTYPNVVSAVRDLKVEDVYVSHSGKDKDNIVARCSCITVRNDALPGEISNWADVHTYSESWAIAFNPSGKIINATRQVSTALDNNPPGY